MPVYGRLEASNGILQFKGYPSRNYGVGANRLPLCSFQMWDVNFIDFWICIRYISKHPHFKCDLFFDFKSGNCCTMTI